MILANSVIMTCRQGGRDAGGDTRSGFDLEYDLNRTAGKKTGGYYPNAAQHGEPDGRCFGAACRLPQAPPSA